MTLTEEADRATLLLGGRSVSAIIRHRDSEVLIQFTDGARLFVDAKGDVLELSVTGIADAASE